jgi:hypothetical protein
MKELKQLLKRRDEILDAVQEYKKQHLTPGTRIVFESSGKRIDAKIPEGEKGEIDAGGHYVFVESSDSSAFSTITLGSIVEIGEKNQMEFPFAEERRPL